jgi:LysR family hydrogen peroxide-inducible transcriptional activator
VTLRELQYLVALAETRHFGRAAERCLITQPTLSTQLRKLEEFLGVRLFERNNRRLEITPVGSTIVAEAKHLLASAHAIETLARGARDPMGGRLALGIIPTLAPYLLPWFLPALTTEWPELGLAVREETTRVLLRMLDAHEIDAALLALPVQGAGLAVEPLFVEPFRAILPRRHALAARETVPVSALAESRLLLLDEGHCLREQALAICRHPRADGEEDALRATSLETVRQMVAAGLGVSLMPLLAVQAEDARLAVRHFALPVPARRIGVVWRKISPRVAAIRRLGGLVRDSLPEGVRPVAAPPRGRPAPAPVQLSSSESQYR